MKRSKTSICFDTLDKEYKWLLAKIRKQLKIQKIQQAKHEELLNKELLHACTNITNGMPITQKVGDNQS